MNYVDELVKNENIFLAFMREKYHMFNNSNIFLRDVQYAVKSYFRKDNIELNYSEYEKIALDFLGILTGEGKLNKIEKNVWKVNFSPSNNVTVSDNRVEGLTETEEL